MYDVIYGWFIVMFGLVFVRGSFYFPYLLTK
jgi:hypothetical protein